MEERGREEEIYKQLPHSYIKFVSPHAKEWQFSTTSTFVLNLQPEVLRKSLVSNMAMQSDNINSMEIS